MLQEKINRAYHSLMKLKEYNLPVKKAYGIYKVLCAIDEAYQFALAEEQKYLAEYNGVLSDNGSITFPTPADCDSFKEKVDELCRVDVDIDITPVQLSEDDLKGQTITPSDIYNLEGFINFE